MKTKAITILVAILLVSLGSYAGAINGSETDTVCSDNPTTSVNITVVLTPDCPPLQTCQLEILIYDLGACTDNVQPIDRQDYVYGYNNYFSENFTYNYVRVCVRAKPGTTCNANLPKCVCSMISPSMNIPIDICH